MKKSVSLSLNENEYQFLEEDAIKKGLTLSQYCKMATFSYFNRYGGAKGKNDELLAMRGKVSKTPED